MRTRSFRFRLALFSALVSGVILLAFGLAAWYFVYRNLLDSVDERLKVPVERMARRVHLERDWDRFREGMRFFNREFEQEIVILVVANGTGANLFVSEESGRTGWMEDGKLIKAHLPSAEALADAPPPPPERRERPERPERTEDSAAIESGTPPPPPDRERDRSRGGSVWKLLGPPEYFTTTGEDGTHWRTAVASNSSVSVFMATDLALFDAEVGNVRNYFVVATSVGLVAIAAGAWAISRRAIRPLDRVIATASAMDAADLGRRIPLTGSESEEFSKLVEVLNAMMERLEVSFNQATRFTADASHELKTPIAIMQAEIESALKTCRPDSPEEESLMNLQEENQRLKRITQSLLLLSQVDSGKLKLSEEDVNLSTELEDLAEDAELLCAKAGLQFSSDITAGLKVRADRVLLVQAVQNLLSNAIKYNSEGGEVSCRLAAEGGEVVLEFFNTGTPIPLEDQGKIFDRFFRVDKARGVVVEGFGLGLNLALEIVRAHGGALELAESDGNGTRMQLRLPAA